MRSSRLAAIALASFVLACSNDPVGPPTRITALPRALTSQEQQLIQADNRLAIKLLKQTSTDFSGSVPNVFISPLSVAMALTMTYNGAAGETEAAMRSTLELDGMSLAEVNQSNQSLIELLRGLDPHVKFKIANSIWYRLGFHVEQPFIDANHTYFDARVDSLDFSAPGAAQTINDWVKTQTNGLIPDIVPSPLPQDELMYLIDAIYFKGDWTRQFNKALTAPRTFYLADGSTVEVPTMTFGDEVKIRTAQMSQGLMIDLPYGGAAFSMTILLPSENLRVDSVLASLTLDQWNSGVSALDSLKTELYMPKFKLENDLTLNATLSTLGMGVAFSDFADFSRMTPQSVMISDVKHRTYVDVNEEGTEAAAATSVGIEPSSAPPTVEVNRPFIFALREDLSGTILFMGVIRHPPESP